MNSNRSTLACAIAATIGAVATADAAQQDAILTEVASFSPNGSSVGNIGSSTATWQYDDTTQVLTQTAGTFNVRFTIVPTTTLFRHVVTGLLIGNAAPASGTSFKCSEGNFGANVGASICGNYTFAANGRSDSTTSWGPGVAFARTLGGDDVALGPQQSIAAYDTMTATVSGSTLVLSNAACTPSGNGCQGANQGGFNSGYRLTLSTAPPSAVDDGPVAVTEGVAAVIPVGANDVNFTDPSTIEIVTQPTQGTITAISPPGSPANLTITYTANIGATGADSFGYRITDSTAASDSATVTLAISPVPDTSPDAFGFEPEFGVEPGTLVTSRAIVVSGISAPVPISVTGGAYSIDAAEFTTASGTVSAGQTVIVRQVSSLQTSTSTDATVTIGGVSGTFTVTTIGSGGGGALDGLSLLALGLLGIGRRKGPARGG
jgi:hypothetical protein